MHHDTKEQKMTKQITIGLMGIFLTIGCGGQESGAHEVTLSHPAPVYNQAYQENFAADSIADITTHAKNSYVLLDPFGDNVTEHIPAIKQHNNQVGGYICRYR